MKKHKPIYIFTGEGYFIKTGKMTLSLVIFLLAARYLPLLFGFLKDTQADFLNFANLHAVRIIELSLKHHLLLKLIVITAALVAAFFLPARRKTALRLPSSPTLPLASPLNTQRRTYADFAMNPAF